MAERPSAAKEALSKIEDELTCPICLEPYTNPRLLACFHVYCQHCLDSIAARDQQGQLSITCPKCRHSTPLPPNGVSGLQAAFHIHNLFEIQKTLKKIREPQKLACEKCLKTTRQATSYCRHCSEFICDFCTTAHTEWQQFKGHEVVSLEKVEGDLIRLVSPRKETPCCVKHDENLKLYCEPCGELICTHCTVHLHKDHKYCVITDTFESHKKEILASLEPVQKQLEAINKALGELDNRCDAIVARKVHLNTDIQTAFEEIRKTLDTREAELVAQLEDHTQQQLKKLSAQRSKVEIFQTQRETCVHFVKESIHSGSPGDVLKTKAGVVEHMKELVDTFDTSTLEPCEQASTSFISSAQLVKDCQEFGLLCQKIDLPQISEVGIKGTAKFRLLLPTKPVVTKAQLVSKLTNQTIECVVTERGKGEYDISYEPNVGGAHQLHVRVGGEEVTGSPFPVIVKTPVDKRGTVIKTIDVENPYGIAVNTNGEMLVTEMSRISIFNSKGVLARTLDTQTTKAGRMKYSRGVAIDFESNIIVMDTGNCRLLKLSRGGDLIAAVGSKGNGPGQFIEPAGMCVNNVNRKVYATDFRAHCVQVFNSDLTYAMKFGTKGSRDGQFESPWDITSDSTGCVYVTDYQNYRVQVFTSDGGYLRQFGMDSKKVFGPSSICVDGDGLVYVGDNVNSCVSVFTSTGEWIKSFGSQLSGPFGIAVAEEVVYVSSYYLNKIQLF